MNKRKNSMDETDSKWKKSKEMGNAGEMSSKDDFIHGIISNYISY